MSRNIIPFDYSGTQVRVVERDGEPWLLARDVCDILGLGNVTEALRELDDDELTSEILNSGSQRREMKLVSEPGFYKMVGRSRKPEARQFDRWVRHNVLPQIRKTGSYTAQVPQTYAEALQLAANQARELEETRPKARSYDAIADTEGTFALSDIGKKLGWGPNKFIEQLRADGVLFYRRQGSKHVNIPYQEHIDAGRFTVRTIQLDPLRQQTRVTGRGELWLAKQYTLGHVEAS
jgi:prophage antirepressor-like protein